MNKRGNFGILGNPYFLFIIFILAIIFIPHAPLSENTENNLCSEIKVYSSLLERACGQFEGSWTCENNKVGCLDFPKNQISCDGSKAKEVKEKCEDLGGEFICDQTSLYCEK